MSRPSPTSSTPDVSLTEVESLLREVLADLEPAPDVRGPGRPRILPAMALWTGLLVCVLRAVQQSTGPNGACWRLGHLRDCPPLSRQRSKRSTHELAR